MSFRRLAHADVADRRCHQDSFGAFKRAQHDLDGKLAAILASPDEFDPGANLLRQRLRRASRPVRDDPFREALGNDVLHLLSDQFIAAVAKLLFRPDIQQNDVSCHVYYHHGIGSRFQQSAVPGLRLFALGEIVAELRKSTQISIQISQRCKHKTCQES